MPEDSKISNNDTENIKVSPLLEENLTYFTRFIRGEIEYAYLKDHMAYYKTVPKEIAENFHQRHINEESIQKEIINFLKSLGKQDATIQAYLQKDLTIYQFFVELQHEHKAQIKHITAIIREIEAQSWFGGKFYASLVGILAAGGKLLEKHLIALLKSIIDFINKYPMSFQIWGLFLTTVLSAYFLVQLIQDEGTIWQEKLPDVFNLTIKFILNAAAYSLLIAENLAHIAPILFILSGSFDLVKALILFVKDYDSNPQFHESVTGKNLLRQRSAIDEHNRALLIDIGMGVLVLGLALAWNLLPGGFLFSLTCLAISLVFFAIKSYIHGQNLDYSRDKLQSDLAKLDDSEEDLNPEPQEINGIKIKEGQEEEHKAERLSKPLLSRANSAPDLTRVGDRLSAFGVFKRQEKAKGDKDEVANISSEISP